MKDVSHQGDFTTLFDLKLGHSNPTQNMFISDYIIFSSFLSSKNLLLCNEMLKYFYLDSTYRCPKRSQVHRSREYCLVVKETSIDCDQPKGLKYVIKDLTRSNLRRMQANTCLPQLLGITQHTWWCIIHYTNTPTAETSYHFSAHGLYPKPYTNTLQTVPLHTESMRYYVYSF